MRQSSAPNEESKAFAESLSDEDLEYLKQVARKTCARVASASRMDTGGSVAWEPIGHKDGVDIYIGESGEDRKTKTPTSLRKYLCGVTHIPATIDDIVHFFHSKSELQRLKNEGKTKFNAFEREILNTKTLYKIRKRTSNNPRHCITLKWMRLGSTVEQIEDRDFVFLECQDTIFDEKVQRRGWVCSMHSVQLPGCPPLDGYVRGSMYRSGYVFRETETPNVLQVVCIMDMDFKGELNVNMTNLMLKARVMIVGSIREHFTGIQEQLHQPQDEDDAQPCPLCEDYLASTPCVSCDQVVCMNCCELVDEDHSVCSVCISQGKVDEMMATQDNDTDDDEGVSIMLPHPRVQPVSNHSLDEPPNQNDASDNIEPIEDATQVVEAVKIQAPGFFAGLWASSAMPSQPTKDEEQTDATYVEPDGTDPLYKLAVERLKAAATAEQQDTRLALVNLYYQHSIAA
ncbi:unnamed protein product [Aphanomyces euteiches]